MKTNILITMLASLALSALTVAGQPPSWEQYWHQGIEALAANRLDEAGRLLQQATLRAPTERAEIHNTLGALALKRNQTKLALLHFGRAEKLNPDYPEVLKNLATIAEAGRQFEHARDYWTRYIEQQPNDPMAYYRRATALHQLQQVSAAQRDLKTAIDIKPNFVAAWHELGFSQIRQRQYASACSSFRQLLRIRPGSTNALYGKALAFRGMERYDDALQAFARISEPGPDTLIEMAMTRLKRNQQGDAAAAEDLLDRARRLPADRGRASYLCGLRAAETGKFELAVTCLETALAKNYAPVKTRFALCSALIQQDRPAAAMPHVQTLAATPNLPAVMRSQVDAWLQR